MALSFFSEVLFGVKFFFRNSINEICWSPSSFLRYTCFWKSTSISADSCSAFIYFRFRAQVSIYSSLQLYFSQALVLFITYICGSLSNEMLSVGSFIQYVRKIFQKTNIYFSPDTHTYVWVWGGKKCLFCRTFCVRINWIIPVAAEYWKVLKYRGVFRTLWNI